MTRRKIVFWNDSNSTWYVSEEYNGDKEDFAAMKAIFGPGADGCDKTWPEIMEMLNGVSSMADFLKVIPQINHCYHSHLDPSDSRNAGARLGIAHDLEHLTALVADLDEVYLLKSNAAGIGRMTFWEGKPVLDGDTFRYHLAKRGDFVTQAVVDDAMDCLPPVCMRSGCSQMGEPYSNKYDEWNGKWRNTYATFRKVAGEWPNGVWEYCGHCFCGETEERGMDMPIVAASNGGNSNG